MTVVLDKDVERLVSERAASSGSDAAVLVNDLLRSLWSAESSWREWPPELETWLLESVDSPVSPLTTADFDAIRAKAKERLGTRAA